MLLHPGEGIGCKDVQEGLLHGLRWPGKVSRTWDITQNWGVCEISKQYGDLGTHFWEKRREERSGGGGGPGARKKKILGRRPWRVYGKKQPHS